MPENSYYLVLHLALANVNKQYIPNLIYLHTTSTYWKATR